MKVRSWSPQVSAGGDPSRPRGPPAVRRESGGWHREAHAGSPISLSPSPSPHPPPSSPPLQPAPPSPSYPFPHSIIPLPALSASLPDLLAPHPDPCPNFIPPRPLLFPQLRLPSPHPSFHSLSQPQRTPIGALLVLVLPISPVRLILPLLSGPLAPSSTHSAPNPYVSHGRPLSTLPCSQDLDTPLLHQFIWLPTHLNPPGVPLPLPHLQLLFAPLPLLLLLPQDTGHRAPAAAQRPAAVAVLYLPTFPHCHPGSLPWLCSPWHLSRGFFGSTLCADSLRGSPGEKSLSTLPSSGHDVPPHPTPTFLLSLLCDSAFWGGNFLCLLA